MNVKDWNFGQIVTAVTIPTTSETLIVTCNQLAIEFPTALIVVQWEIHVSIGTSGATLTAKLYHGTAVAGTPVFTGDALNVSGGTKVQCGGQFEEQVNNQAGLQYTLSLTVASATTNSVADVGGMVVLVG